MACFSSQIQFLVFDLDGTLIDSSDGVVACFNYVFDEIGVARPEPQAIKATIGYPLDEAFARFTGHDSKLCYDLFQVKAREVLVESARLLEGVDGTLRHLYGQGFILGVATTKRSEHITGILERLKVLQLFRSWTGSDEVRRVKPDPEVLQVTLRKLGASPDQAVYVGDTPLDIQAARAAGMASVAVLGGTGSREELAEERPDYMADRFEELGRVFARKGSAQAPGGVGRNRGHL